MATEINILKFVNRFDAFLILNIDDIDILRRDFPEKKKIRTFLKKRIQTLFSKYNEIDYELEIDTKIEILIILTELCLNNNIDDLEICTIFSIFWKTLELSFRKYNRREVFDYFKKSLIVCSMDRPPYQINIFKKETLQILSDFFIDKVYKKFELLRHLLTKKDNVIIENLDMTVSRLPHILDLSLGTEISSKSIKILKSYTQSRKAKTELDAKIEQVVDFEREILDKLLEEKFAEQDHIFNKKLDELLTKKKKQNNLFNSHQTFQKSSLTIYKY